ncbi:MAG: hypothetical protein EZS28_024297 [Streblomastix strix]|uniref:Uncharacterized protein n=1 Tax=Streblomastix strix TaxID=222440 RepID=A0A5J4VC75_9EUKA|nr:MAG: hypothetical protein EZS28_024297 [Streblomastix strix]
MQTLYDYSTVASPISPSLFSQHTMNTNALFISPVSQNKKITELNSDKQSTGNQTSLTENKDNKQNQSSGGLVVVKEEAKEKWGIMIKEKVDQMNTFIPYSFYLRLMITLPIISSFAAVYFFICAYTLFNLSTLNSVLFLSSYRIVLLSDIVALSVSIAAPPTLEMISAIPSSLNVIDEQATNPIWRDLSHTSSNNTILQKLISGLIPYVINVHRRVKEGGNRYDSQYLTGDESIDSLKTHRTVKAGSRLNDLLVQTQECIELIANDCDNSGRIYGLSGSFAGLEGLMEQFMVYAMNIVQASQTQLDSITLGDPSIQFMTSAIGHDLQAGFQQYGSIMEEEHLTNLEFYQTLQIIFFIFSLVTTLGSFFFCLFPNNSALSVISMKTNEINLLNPENDQMEN